MQTARTYVGQRVARPDVGFPDAPGGQQGVEVVVIAGHQVICGALEHLGVHNVDAVGVQRQRIMRQGPAKHQETDCRLFSQRTAALLAVHRVSISQWLFEDHEAFG